MPWTSYCLMIVHHSAIIWIALEGRITLHRPNLPCPLCSQYIVVLFPLLICLIYITANLKSYVKSL